MKIYFLAILVFTLTGIKAQVGINTTSPQSTLDVIGKPADVNTKDGILPPRITGTQLRGKNSIYGTDQNGTIIYVTEADPSPATKTVYVTSPGYYFYDAPNSVWKKLANDNEVSHNQIIFGNAPDNGVNALNWAQQYYTGGSINLTPGRWTLEYGSYMVMGTVSNGTWTQYPNNKVISANGSAWCACSLSSTSGSYTAVDTSTGLVNGSGRGGATGIYQGGRSAVSQGKVLLDINQPRTYYLFVSCNNYGTSLGTDRPGNIFGSAWERWFYATPF